MKDRICLMAEPRRLGGFSARVSHALILFALLTFPFRLLRD